MNLPELWSTNPLAMIAALTHHTGNVSLDEAFDLIEGQFGYAQDGKTEADFLGNDRKKSEGRDKS